MIGKLYAAIRAHIAAFWDLEDPEERIEGSGEPYLDPAYNEQYTAERRLQAMAAEEDPSDEPEN